MEASTKLKFVAGIIGLYTFTRYFETILSFTIFFCLILRVLVLLLYHK